jgi:hypothetical protein
MLDTLKRIVAFTRSARRVLREFYGRGWPLVLVRSLVRARRLIRTTSWAGRADREARLVRALALLPALCLDARERLGEAAPHYVRELATALVEAEIGRFAQEVGLSEIADPRERWHAFVGRAIADGLGAFNENEFLSVESDRYHLRVVRCLMADLARETDVPELGQALCDASAALHGRLLPTHEFSRGGSMRRTLAYGHPCCEHVWERRDTAVAADQLARPSTPAADRLERAAS